MHRTPRSGWSKTWPFLLVAVVFAGLAYGGVALLSDNGATDDPPQAQSTEPPPAETEEPPAAEEPPATEEPRPRRSRPRPRRPRDPGPRDAHGGGRPECLRPRAERQRHRRRGGQGKDALDAQGFSNTVATDYTNGPAPVDATTVWYVPDRSDTAAAVAATLGIPAENVVQVDSLREGDVAVIIKSELAPVG